MGAVEGEGASRGYEKFKEVAQDISKLVDVIWVSGTPSLQKQYLLVLAQLVCDYLPSFPSTPQYAFPLLNKLDYALASLLLGEDFETRTALPGFGAGKVISGTDKVRMKSIVERARIVVVDVIENGEKDTESEEEGDNDEEDEEEDYNVEEETPNWDMAIAKVYDRTIVELGQGVDENGLGVNQELSNWNKTASRASRV
ncbi:MAG: hypothetical protein M1824_001902 [Vezdaea acicularis]|nr:MAG: hypothetical protein M1824_001902 [Vezdaea acicularis]